MPELVVAAVLEQGRSKSEVARDYGVSRRWVITLVQRFEAEGPAGLQPRSRRPRRSPTRIPDKVADEIIEIRKDLDHSGHEAGPATIAYHLEQRHGHSPALSTIWRVLTQRGFVIPEPHKRPKSSYVRFEAVQPNERWQTDLTHWSLAEGADVEICNWIDDHSRLCLASRARMVFKAGDVDALFRRTASTWGNPASVLSDNGAVYTGRYRSNGRVSLEITLHHRGIAFVHSRPYHPQTCGKVERFHQTEKKWLARQPRATTIVELQAARHVPPLLQRRSPPPCPGPANATSRLRGPTQSHPASTTPRRRALPSPPRHHRRLRQAHDPLRQPPAPHRHRPQTRRHESPHTDQGPPRADHHNQRRTRPRPRPRPNPGLPTPAQNVNDVPRHL